MRNQIRPEFLSLADLLHKRLFNIPDYQRAYSWTHRERKDLFDDITNVQKEGRDYSHFMSTIVCLRQDEVQLGTDRFIKLDIVDGQQRLTTLIILLKAISQALDRKDKGQKKLFQELSNLLVKGSDDLLLLQTNHDTSYYFANYMRAGGAPSPAEAKTLADEELLDAIQDCKQYVEDWRKKTNLIDLAVLIKNQLFFILHEVPDEKVVHTVFEVLNSRGMEVVWLDRLKSILMKLIFSIKNVNHVAQIRELYTTWRDIYQTIGLHQGLNTEALRFAATLYSSDVPSRPLGEREAVDLLRLKAKEGGAKEIQKIAYWLLKVTKACDAIISNSRQNAVTRIAQARLLAVAIRLGKFEEVDREKLLDAWERVSFRIYGLHDKDARTGVGDYCRLSWDILRSDLSPEDTLIRIRELGKNYPIEEAIDRLRGADCYHDWMNELRYFLYCYEEHLLRKSKKAINPKWTSNWDDIWAKNASQSIEHIEPQSKGSKDTHGLGNLMLLPPNINSKLQAKAPEEKVSHYEDTGFLHAAKVVELLKKDSRWSKKTRKEREKELLDWAKSRWTDG